MREARVSGVMSPRLEREGVQWCVKAEGGKGTNQILLK